MRVLKASSIPNVLSVFRIALVPLFVWLFEIKDERGLAVAVFLLAGVTDVIDGVLARRFGWITNIGKILDPFADKCMQIAALVCLCVSDFIPTWVAAVLVGKELLLLIGAFFALKKEKVYVQSSWYGKAGTVAFYIIATLLVLVEAMTDMIRLMLGILLILFMLFALVMYVAKYKKNIIHSDVIKKKG